MNNKIIIYTKLMEYKESYVEKFIVSMFKKEGGWK